MRISFDVDDTLVCAPTVPTEQYLRWPLCQWYDERVRYGTRQLMRDLIARRCALWIYTTSYRSPWYLQSWFWWMGVRLEGVVNQDRHDRFLKGFRPTGYAPSKYPPAFGIDLHIDDSEGVAMEGRTHGFRVLVISPNDPDWAAKVLAAVDRAI